ncbi:MAG: hypothetical protein VKJ87_00350 [Synechococcus sp.]|nr:hypothetical protein [Synechococcus sp.]
MAADPLALVAAWPSEVPLISLEEALEQSLLQSGRSREEYLRRLAQDLGKPQLQPLLWLLPRRWRLGAAQWPQRLHGLAQVLEQGLLTPALLAVLSDELAALLPEPATACSALERWRTPPTGSWEQLLELARCGEPVDGVVAAAQEAHLSPGLQWRNVGLHYGQNSAQRQANATAARWLNHAGSQLNATSTPPQGGRQLIAELQQQGWRIEARCRASVASFGFGASLHAAGGPWQQVPIALPLRSGLLDRHGNEIHALLPHSSVELELQGPGVQLLLQFYQGTEGLCGWEALNDLQRPWQNDRQNGTVRYQGEPFSGNNLLELMDLCDVIAWVHNSLASQAQLRLGGYGTLGFCIDTTALVQQACWGHCQLFPLLLGGPWRERLSRCAVQLRGQLPASHQAAIDRYLEALHQLPLDLSLHGSSAEQAWRRLRSSQPSSSPFLLVQHLQDAADHLTAVTL